MRLSNGDIQVPDIMQDSRGFWRCVPDGSSVCIPTQERGNEGITATNDAIAMLADIPLSNRVLKQAHATLMQGVRGEYKQPGEFRHSQNWIGGSSLKDAAFIPPHQEAVPELMGDLEKFWHNEEITLPHLIRLAISHYQFETIHPFLDGNGRVGRLLIPLYLISNKLLAKPSLYMSDFFERNRSSYYDALMRVRMSNDLIHWVRFFLNGVLKTANNGRDLFQKILSLRKHIDSVTAGFGKRTELAREAMNVLYRRPIVSAAELQTQLQITAPTAHSLIKSLVENNVLREFTGRQRGRLYVFDKYLQLFLN